MADTNKITIGHSLGYKDVAALSKACADCGSSNASPVDENQTREPPKRSPADVIENAQWSSPAVYELWKAARKKHRLDSESRPGRFLSVEKCDALVGRLGINNGDPQWMIDQRVNNYMQNGLDSPLENTHPPPHEPDSPPNIPPRRRQIDIYPTKILSPFEPDREGFSIDGKNDGNASAGSLGPTDQARLTRILLPKEFITVGLDQHPTVLGQEAIDDLPSHFYEVPTLVRAETIGDNHRRTAFGYVSVNKDPFASLKRKKLAQMAKAESQEKEGYDGVLATKGREKAERKVERQASQTHAVLTRNDKENTEKLNRPEQVEISSTESEVDHQDATPAHEDSKPQRDWKPSFHSDSSWLPSCDEPFISTANIWSMRERAIKRGKEVGEWLHQVPDMVAIQEKPTFQGEVFVIQKNRPVPIMTEDGREVKLLRLPNESAANEVAGPVNVKTCQSPEPGVCGSCKSPKTAVESVRGAKLYLTPSASLKALENWFTDGPKEPIVANASIQTNAAISHPKLNAWKDAVVLEVKFAEEGQCCEVCKHCDIVRCQHRQKNEKVREMSLENERALHAAPNTSANIQPPAPEYEVGHACNSAQQSRIWISIGDDFPTQNDAPSIAVPIAPEPTMQPQPELSVNDAPVSQQLRLGFEEHSIHLHMQKATVERSIFRLDECVCKLVNEYSDDVPSIEYLDSLLAALHTAYSRMAQTLDCVTPHTPVEERCFLSLQFNDLWKRQRELFGHFEDAWPKLSEFPKMEKVLTAIFQECVNNQCLLDHIEYGNCGHHDEDSIQSPVDAIASLQIARSSFAPHPYTAYLNASPRTYYSATYPYQQEQMHHHIYASPSASYDVVPMRNGQYGPQSMQYMPKQVQMHDYHERLPSYMCTCAQCGLARYAAY